MKIRDRIKELRRVKADRLRPHPTACWWCPGQCGLQAAALQDHYPGLANEIRVWEKLLGVVRPDERDGGTSFDELVARGYRQRERSARAGITQKSP